MTVLICIFTIALLGAMPVGYAQSNGPRSQFGPLYGFSVPDSDNTNPRQIYGVKGAAYMSPTFSLGGYYLLSEKEEGTGGRMFKYSLHGLEVATHVPSNNGDTFFGLRVGMTKIKTEPAPDETVIFSPYHYGLTAGYDHFVTSWMSFGFEGHYLSVQKANTSKNGNRYEEESFGIIGFLIAMQLRL